MSKISTLKPLAVAMGAAFVTSLATSPVANAAENPFAMSELSSGYMVADSHMEGKCGEGKCGGDKAKKEGKCGGDKAKKEGKCGEGKCGADKDRGCSEEAKAAKEGKCGGDKAKSMKEGKCGEGKCGGNKADDAEIPAE